MIGDLQRIVVQMASDVDPSDSPHIKALIGSIVEIRTDNAVWTWCLVTSITNESGFLNDGFITVTTQYEMDDEVEGVNIPFKDINEITYI